MAGYGIWDFARRYILRSTASTKLPQWPLKGRYMEFYKKGGMTLVELLSSIIILVVMLTAMLGSYIFSMQLNELVKHKIAAVYAAKTILETMKKTTLFNIFFIYSNKTKNN